MAHQVVWFDIPVRDLNRAAAFYSAVLDCELSLMEGAPVAVLPHAGETVGGCLVQTEDSEPGAAGPLIYLNAAGRLAAAVGAVEANGGKLLQPVHDIGPHGQRAVILDSEGNRVALHSP